LALFDEAHPYDGSVDLGASKAQLNRMTNRHMNGVEKPFSRFKHGFNSKAIEQIILDSVGDKLLNRTHCSIGMIFENVGDSSGSLIANVKLRIQSMGSKVSSCILSEDRQRIVIIISFELG
jgi:hypothetical protein